mgnify:CR=1 FL=1
MSETININVKATDKGLHVLVWSDDDEGDTTCIHDFNLTEEAVHLALSTARRMDTTVSLGNFNITASPKIVDKWGKQVIDFTAEAVS